MKFCSECGHPVRWSKVAGDDRARFVCGQCGTVHYQNPRVVVGTIPELDGSILLCRRAIEPRKNWWTLPAGYLENGETLRQGAQRETMEEACARLKELQPYALFNITHIQQVYFFFRAQLVDPDFGPGAESLEVELFSLEDIPWAQLAFPVIEDVLQVYCRDVAGGTFPFRELDVSARMHT